LHFLPGSTNSNKGEICLFDLAENALLYTHTGKAHYRQYFNIYWYGLGARTLLTLGLLWDVIRCLPTLRFVPKHIGLMLATFGLTITAAAVYLTLRHHPHTFPITAQVLMIRECVSVSWMCFGISLLASISLLGLGWSLEAVDVTAGFIASGMAALVASNLMSSWPTHGHMIDLIQNCIEIAVILSWIKTIGRPLLPDEVLSDSALNTLTALFEEHQL
jgi:hypothetical protein